MNKKLNIILGIIVFIELGILPSWYAKNSDEGYDFFKPTLKSMTTPKKIDAENDIFTYYATNIEIENSHLEEERFHDLIGVGANDSTFSVNYADYYKLLENTYSNSNYDLDYHELCCKQVIPAGCTVSPIFVISKGAHDDMSKINISYYDDNKEYGNHIFLKTLTGYKKPSISGKLDK